MLSTSGGERTVGAGALQLNRWFISSLRDLQPSLPISAPDTRAEEVNPEQMFPLLHYQCLSWGRGGGEGRRK